jgi:uncharacterized protein (DUF952 family)
VLIFHIAFPADWDAARSGAYTSSTRDGSLEDEGFIHCSRPSQVQQVIDGFYADVEHDLLLLAVDTDRLSSPWQLDDVPGAPEPFPHIYGPMNVDAVVDVLPLRRVADGFVLPDLPA